MPWVAVVQGRRCGLDKIVAPPTRNLDVALIDDPVFTRCRWSDEPAVDNPIAA